ncbi:E3 ubiquitin-protein ligase RNF166-like [Ostrea edulis]|uniref:E3 ubiquitin-protein ligase RNF166-like n=1 Tax=Ostrea edulis TaxID=37623 RepID=UPI002094E24D|nr:E3 ubiquitin-protein ligase RNF166-like [Ostrea edulis]
MADRRKQQYGVKSDIDSELAPYKCPICLEIFRSPVHIKCGHNHTYCTECIAPYQSHDEAQCPECRGIFDPHDLRRATDLEHAMRTVQVPCRWCGQMMAVCRQRSHSAKCKQRDLSLPKFKPVAETTQMYPANLPNRSTFSCPVCHLQNLDCSDLIRHCNEKHSQQSGTYVCPVCSAMPWGDPNYCSPDIVHHLNIRHKFEYDTYVDFNQDEDEMLRQALHASLEQA